MPPVHATTTIVDLATKDNQTNGEQKTQIVDTTNTEILGSKSDAAATTDTGTFSLMAFIKRGLQNWTTFLSRMPVLGQALMSGSIPVVIASNQTPIQVLFPTTNGSTTVDPTLWVANTAYEVIAASSVRRGFTITNNTSKSFLIRLGADNVQSSIYTVSLSIGGIYEIPVELATLRVSAMFTTGGSPTGTLTLTISTV